jgi:hypothetical protein
MLKLSFPPYATKPHTRKKVKLPEYPSLGMVKVSSSFREHLAHKDLLCINVGSTLPCLQQSHCCKSWRRISPS